MSEMVDRVAAAIHGVHGIMVPYAAMNGESEIVVRLRAQAMAAIAAMREPTEAMVDAGTKTFVPPDYACAEQCFMAMIEEAQKDHK